MSPVSRSLLVLCALLTLPLGAGARPRAAERGFFDRAAIDTGTQNSGAFIQDSDGFLWIGTVLGGVYRYDGYDLKAYMPGGPGTISGAGIFALYEDRDGALWMATGNGLNRYDKATDAFTQYRHDPQRQDSISHDSWQFPAVQVIRGDRQGRLWIGTRNGLNRLDPRTGRFERFLHDPADASSLSSNNVRAVFVDHEGTLWAGTEDGLNRFDETSRSFTRYRGDPANPRGLGNGRITALCEDEAGSLWVGTEGGLYRLDPGAAGFARYLHAEADPNTPRADYCFALSRDRSGVIWLTYINARQAGLSALDPRRPPFQVYRADPRDANSLPNTAALRIIQDHQGTIWISTRPTGLTSFDKRTGAFTRHLNDRYYPAVLEDGAGMFWLGSTVPGTLHAFDPRSGRIVRSWTNVPGDSASLAATPQINDIVRDRRDPNILWLLLYGAGVDRFDKRTGRFTHFTHDPNNPDTTLSASNSWMIFQDNDGILWIPTQGAGLDRLDPATGIVRHFTEDPVGDGGPATSSLRTVCQDASGALWIGSSVGLDRMDPSTLRFTHYTEKTGFPGISVVSIGQDSSGALWIGTSEAGLVRFDEATGRVKVFGERDGLHGDAFYPWNALRDGDGEMWFGGPKGVTRFQPRSIVDNAYIPPVVLTALKQGGEPLHTGSSPERVSSVSLDWRGNFFEFEFAALNFTQAARNRYRYMLEGWDKGWFDAGTRRFGRYSGLLPGAYTLHVTGSNNEGLWNPVGVSVKVTVAPPWWRTWWFISLSAAAAGAVLAAFLWSMARRRRTARAAAQAIRESEERYRTLFENTPIGVSVTTPEGRVLALNGVLSRMVGYSGAESRIMNVVGVYRNLADRARVLEELKRSGSVRDFETVWVRKDGRAFDASLTVTPISLDGRPAFLTVVNDVSQRNAAEAERNRLLEQVREQADRVRRIMDTVADGVFLLDSAGRVTLANPAALRALAVLADGDPEAPAGLGNRPLAELLAPPSDGGWHQVELPGPPPVSFEIAARPIETDPASGSWVLVVRDVTREREMQQRMRQQEKLAAVGQLTAGIAHDFNNLLTTINGFAELGQAEPVSGSDSREWMGSILASGRRAADLVRQLLAFSRRQVVEPRVLNVNDVVAGMDKMLRRIIGEDVAWTPRLAPDLWSIRADPTQIEQVIMNLAVNARDAMLHGGTLTVETANVVLDRESAAAHGVECAGEHVLLSVSDTGTGMTDEVKAHLFEPFFTTKAQGKGTGLGLATVFGVVKQCGGAVTAYSEIGRGTVFRIYLPRTLEEVQQGPAAASEAVDEAPLGSTVLLVEDAPGVRDLARLVLRKLRCTVLVAEDPAEAMRLSEEHAGPIHVLVTDVIMPGMNGKDLADRLIGQRPKMRVLFMSGYTDSVIGFHGLIESGAAFLQKPFLPADLSRKVRELLRSYQS